MNGLLFIVYFYQLFIVVSVVIGRHYLPDDALELHPILDLLLLLPVAAPAVEAPGLLGLGELLAQRLQPLLQSRYLLLAFGHL